MKRAGRVFVLVFILHSIVQFFAWAEADAVHPMRKVWLVVSVPVFALFPGWGDSNFWFASVANSLVWTAVISLVLMLTANRAHR